MNHKIILRLLSLSVLLLAAGRADALTLLTEGKAAVLRGSQAGGSAWIRVGKDRALRALRDPTRCPSSSSLRISSYPVAQNLVVGDPEVELPCTGWRRIPDGYLYRDATGSAAGVREIRYTSSGLEVRASAPGFTPVEGPVGFVQLWFTVDGERHLVRFHDFARNDARSVVARSPSPEAAAGEAAFWDTLWGDADREDEAIALLERATARARRDGRAPFLLAMTHLNRFGRMVADPDRIDPAAERAIAASTIAFDRAQPLLWDGEVGDSRVPGFAAAARYARAAAARYPAAIERAVAELEEAARINPLFNSFDVFGVAMFIAPRDPLYARVLELLDVEFPSLAGQCATQAEICFNGGMAPHNLEGTFFLFGDLYAKGGRLEDARSYYELAASLGESGGWREEFLAAARSRRDGVARRVALYQDADPTNDPPLMGGGGAGNCAYCHAK